MRPAPGHAAREESEDIQGNKLRREEREDIQGNKLHNIFILFWSSFALSAALLFSVT